MNTKGLLFACIGYLALATANKTDSLPRRLRGHYTHKYDCNKGCSLGIFAPVCGKDNVTYTNECLAVCQGVEIEHRRACDGSVIEADSYVTIGQASPVIWNEFQQNHLKFVGRREFQENDIDAPPAPESNASNVTEPTTPRFGMVTASGDEFVSDVLFDKEIDDLAEGSPGMDSETDELPDFGVFDDFDDRRRLDVVGYDSRQKIYSTTDFAYQVIGQLVIKTLSGYTWCTGTLISPNAVLTAGHCIYSRKNKSFNTIESFVPARDRNNAPYGVWKPFWMYYYIDFQTASDTEAGQWDLAVILLEPKNGVNLSYYTGYAGWQTTYHDSRHLQRAVITGYPYDKTYGEMWTTGTCAGTWTYYSPYEVSHSCDTVPGYSGSALMSYDTSLYRRVMGVHWSGSPVAAGYNVAVLLQGTHVTHVKSWAGLP